MEIIKAAAIIGVIVAALVQCMAAQRVHVVGDGLGWTIPPGGASAYSNWASSNSFAVGDVLTFNFPSGGHDVVKVPKASFDSCSDDGATQTITTGPANVTIDSAGDHFFICTIGTHCSRGQKLAITASTTTTPSPPSTTTPTTPSPTSPEICPPETAPSPVAGGPTSTNNLVPPPSLSAAPAAFGGFLFSMGSIIAVSLVF